MGTLFEDLAAGRPERLVHNALLHGLANDEALAGWMAAKVFELDTGGDPIPFHIGSEEVDERSGWRTDITLKWKANPDKVYRIELKLNAPATKRQMEAARSGRVDLIICPHGEEQVHRDRFGNRTRVISWHEVAEAISIEGTLALLAIRLLLEQADNAHGTFVNQIKPEVVRSELTMMMDPAADGRCWPTIYWFLYTIDYLIRDSVTPEFQYLWSKTTLSKSGGYYGWAFNITRPGSSDVRKRPWWLGFVVKKDGTEVLGLWFDNEHVPRWSVDAPFPTAESITEAVVAAAVSRCKSMAGDT